MGTKRHKTKLEVAAELCIVVAPEVPLAKRHKIGTNWPYGKAMFRTSC